MDGDCIITWLLYFCPCISVHMYSNDLGELEAEARYYLSQNHRFKGLCMSSSNCANVCQTENFPGGECKAEGATRKCFYNKIC